MYHLGGMLTVDDMPEELHFALEDEHRQVAKALGVPQERIDEGVGPDLCVDFSLDHGLTGLLVKVATPVAVLRSDGYFFGWDCFSTGWLYGDSLDELFPAIEAWVEERRQEEREQAVGHAAHCASMAN